MKGWSKVKINVQGRAITRPFLIADEVMCNMLAQDAILRLGFVIDGNRCYIRQSYSDKGEKIYINSVDFNTPTLRDKTTV